MPHWINVTGRYKGQKFRCSKCGNECNCIGRGNASKIGGNYCDYQYCPRCGVLMDLEGATILRQIEVQGKAVSE